MKNTQHKVTKRKRRHAKVRAKISGTATVPRLTVFRSNKFIYAQLINDVAGTTLAQADDSKAKKGTKVERAKEVGAVIAKAAKAAKIESIVFDRSGYLFAGRVKAIAEGAREAGLQF